MKEAAGVLLYRWRAGELEVLLVHSSGAYNRGKPWGIPKGLIEAGEGAEDAARRETWEETGVSCTGALVSLGTVEYRKSRKRIYGFAGEAVAECAPRCASWEIDCAEFVGLARARDLIHPDQKAFLDRLESLLNGSRNG